MADLTVPMDEAISAGDPGHAAMHAAAADYINELAARVTAGVVEVPTAVNGTQPYQKQQVDTLLGSVPTLDELIVVGQLGTITASTWPIFLAPFPCRIVQASMMTESAVGSSASANYNFELRRIRSNPFTTFASKTTNAADGAGGQAIGAWTEWSFDNVTWNAAVAGLSRGDGVGIRMSVLTGSPTPTSLTKTIVALRYVPL